MTSATPAPIVYDSARRGLLFVEEAKALWLYRHLVAELVGRDIKVRYKRSVLGVAWTMLSPLLNMLAMTWVFSLVMRMDVKNFPVYFLTGSIFWAFFAGATSHAASLTIDAAEITKRVYIPRSVFVVSAVGVALVNLCLSLVPLFLIILFTGFPIHASWLFVPVSILIGALFTTGVGLIVFTLASRFVDIKETYLVLVGAWFFVTPIVYTQAMVPERFRFIVRYNPMTYLVEVFRAPLYDGWLPGPKTLAFAALAAISSLAIGWLFYAARIEEYGRGS
ncbi:MAG: ABC transporter permease [Acidobacteriota bacterium]|nr:ABC transporter permease [Acidobacteriota bacterium]